MNMKTMIFWAIMSCSSEKACLFGGIYCFHRQGQRVIQSRNQIVASVGFLLCLLFDPEDGDDMFLRKAGFLRTTPHYNPEDCILKKYTV
jgi:hypothetical protein